MSYNNLYEAHLYTLLYIVKCEMKIFIFTLDFFLCYSHMKYHDIPLFLITKNAAALKQYITRKIVSMHNTLWCIL